MDNCVKKGEFFWIWRFMPFFRIRKTQGYGLCVGIGYDKYVKVFSFTVTIISIMFDIGIKYR